MSHTIVHSLKLVRLEDGSVAALMSSCSSNVSPRIPHPWLGFRHETEGAARQAMAEAQETGHARPTSQRQLANARLVDLADLSPAERAIVDRDMARPLSLNTVASSLAALEREHTAPREYREDGTQRFNTRDHWFNRENQATPTPGRWQHFYEQSKALLEGRSNTYTSFEQHQKDLARAVKGFEPASLGKVVWVADNELARRNGIVAVADAGDYIQALRTSGGVISYRRNPSLVQLTKGEALPTRQFEDAAKVAAAAYTGQLRQDEATSAEYLAKATQVYLGSLKQLQGQSTRTELDKLLQAQNLKAYRGVPDGTMIAVGPPQMANLAFGAKGMPEWALRPESRAYYTAAKYPFATVSRDNEGREQLHSARGLATYAVFTTKAAHEQWSAAVDKAAAASGLSDEGYLTRNGGYLAHNDVDNAKVRVAAALIGGVAQPFDHATGKAEIDLAARGKVVIERSEDGMATVTAFSRTGKELAVREDVKFDTVAVGAAAWEVRADSAALAKVNTQEAKKEVSMA